MKMVKVRMLVDTAYKMPRKVGDIVDVPEDFAARWTKNGIAEMVGGHEAAKGADVAETEAPATDLEGMTAKELYEMCKAQGIQVEPKKDKATYLAALQGV